MTLVAVDAMGGDDAPTAEVTGAMLALRRCDARIVLFGDERRLTEQLSRLGSWDQSRVTVVHADERVAMSDDPVRVFKRKPRSSLRAACVAVAEGRADALVSAGSSGAILSHAVLSGGRMPGFFRPAIVSVLPTRSKSTLVLCDSGANVDADAQQIAQFALLGVAYDSIVHGHPLPRVGILSNGSEKTKGTVATRGAAALLEEFARDANARLDYAGYVEGSELFVDKVDVVATDGFSGNVVLKVSEGVSDAFFGMTRSVSSDSATQTPAPSAIADALDYRQRGGALLGGVKEVVMVCHGRSDATAVANAIQAAEIHVQSQTVAKLSLASTRYQAMWAGLRQGNP